MLAHALKLVFCCLIETLPKAGRGRSLSLGYLQHLTHHYTHIQTPLYDDQPFVGVPNPSYIC